MRGLASKKTILSPQIDTIWKPHDGVKCVFGGLFLLPPLDCSRGLFDQVTRLCVTITLIGPGRYYAQTTACPQHKFSQPSSALSRRYGTGVGGEDRSWSGRQGRAASLPPKSCHVKLHMILSTPPLWNIPDAKHATSR